MANKIGMANEILGFVDRRRSTAANQQSPFTVIQASNYLDLATMENYLLANGYNQATVNTMTFNDKVYAVRRAVDAAGI